MTNSLSESAYMPSRSSGPLKLLILLVMFVFAPGCGASKTSNPGPANDVVNTAPVDSAYALARLQPTLTSLVVARNGLI